MVLATDAEVKVVTLVLSRWAGATGDLSDLMEIMRDCLTPPPCRRNAKGVAAATRMRGGLRKRAGDKDKEGEV